jgi:hypothetical protein
MEQVVPDAVAQVVLSTPRLTLPVVRRRPVEAKKRTTPTPINRRPYMTSR